MVPILRSGHRSSRSDLQCHEDASAVEMCEERGAIERLGHRTQNKRASCHLSDSLLYRIEAALTK